MRIRYCSLTAQLFCGPAKKNYPDFPPALVVEVLSEATAFKDRHTKFSIYEKFGVQYYLIVDPVTESLEIYLLKNSAYFLQKFGPEISFIFLFSDDCKWK